MNRLYSSYTDFDYSSKPQKYHKRLDSKIFKVITVFTLWYIITVFSDK